MIDQKYIFLAIKLNVFSKLRVVVQNVAYFYRYAACTPIIIYYIHNHMDYNSYFIFLIFYTHNSLKTENF